MGEEEELGLWFDPCGYLVIIIIYVFMMAFWLNDKRINHKESSSKETKKLKAYH